MTERPGTGSTGTMRSVAHDNRSDPRNVFSEMFRRGTVAQADGGRNSKRERARDSEAMKDVDHEAPEDEGASRVWERGGEDDEE